MRLWQQRRTVMSNTMLSAQGIGQGAGMHNLCSGQETTSDGLTTGFEECWYT